MIEIKVCSDPQEIASFTSASISETLTRLQNAANRLGKTPEGVAAVLAAKETPRPGDDVPIHNRIHHIAASEALRIIIDLMSAAGAGLHVTILVNVRPETQEKE